MMGYFVEYDSGDIVIDEKEIVEVDWYYIDNLLIMLLMLLIVGKMVNMLVECLKV